MARADRETPVKRRAFEAWYRAGQNIDRGLELLKQEDPAIRVSRASMYRWMAKFRWVERAREMDIEAAEKVRRDLVEQVAEFRKRQIRTGQLLQKKGIEYLGKNELSNDFSAINAIRLGVEMEMTGLGLDRSGAGKEDSSGDARGNEFILRIVDERRPDLILSDGEGDVEALDGEGH